MKTHLAGGRVRSARLVLFAALLGCCALLAGPSVAAEPVASVEIVGDVSPESQSEPLAVELPPQDAGGSVPLTIPILVRESGDLRVEYVDDIGGTRSSLPSLGQAGESAALQGTLPAGPFVVGDVVLLKLGLVPAEGAEKVEGVISIRTGDNLPLVREVKGSPAGATWAPTQKKIEIETTRLLPFTSTPEATRSVGLTGSGSLASAGKPLAEALVTIGDATGKVTLEQPAAGEGVRAAELKLSQAGGVGSATTTLDLGGKAAPNQQLEVEVKVGDSLVFPIFIILIGALLGKLVPARWDVKRRGRLMRAKLKESVEAYEKAAAKKSPKELGLEDIAEQVGSGDEWPGGLRLWGPAALWGHGDLAKTDNKTASAIYYRLGRASYAGDLEVATEDATDLIDAISSWIAVREALVLLAEEVVQAEKKLAWESLGEAGKKPLNESRSVLSQELKAGSGTAQAGKLAKSIASQASALELYVACRKEDGAEVVSSQAETIYGRVKPPLLRTEEEAQTMIQRLHELLYELRFEVPLRPTVARMFGTGVAVEMTSFPGLETVARVLAPTAAPTTAQVMAGVRLGDWMIFFFALAVSALAYLLPVYSEGPFGTFNQYLVAFVAGAGTQVVVNAALLPLARSYKAGGEEKGESAATVTTTTTS